MELGETVVGSIASQGQNIKYIRGKVIEVVFESPIKVANHKSTVPKPHWKFGENLDEGVYSKRPAVYLIRRHGGDRIVRVKVKITKSNISGKGKLVGILGGLEIEGKCPLKAGEHKVKAKIKEIPDEIQFYTGDIIWGLTNKSQSFALNSSRTELYFILDTPPSFYQGQQGVFVEALRFLCQNAGVLGLKQKVETVRTVTTFCHGAHGLYYDCWNGAPNYMTYPAQTGGWFKLLNYIAKFDMYANCYDQAGAVQSLSGALGVTLTWIFLDPYGYINGTALLGWGWCNNPFFKGDRTKINVYINDVNRTSFGNHAFIEYAGKIFDACAGPVTGTGNRRQYVADCIDDWTNLYVRLGYPRGRAEDMQACGGVVGVV